MRLRTVIFLVAMTALVSYSLGRQDAPADNKVAASVALAAANFNKPVTLAAVSEEAARPIQEPVARIDQPPARTRLPAPAARTETTRSADPALAAAAIAAILIKASRDQYHATGHPCACPDDLMRNGRSCGARSAYSRPGGAAPICYPGDVTEAMISAYRRTASR